MYRNDEISVETGLLNQLSHRCVLVCGACGLIGSSLVEYLLQSNILLSTDIRVIALGRSVEKLRKRFEKYTNLAELILFPADITDETSLAKLISQIDYVIDCASPAHPVAYANNPVDVLKTNIIGTLNLLNLCKLKKSRFLYVSSSEVYGNPFEKVDVDFANTENDYGYIDLLAQRSCYPEGKRAAENLCISFDKQYDCDVVIARLCQVFGSAVAQDNSRADAQFLRKCISKENIILKSPGTQIRSMCYVKDAVIAILYVLLFGKRDNAYNIANKNSIASIRELAECMAETAGVKVAFDIPSDEEKKGFTNITRAVIDATKTEELGWKAKYDFQSAVEDMMYLSLPKEN